MIKFILYTTLFGVGSYVVVTHLPDSYKEKMLAAIGLGSIKNGSFEIFNPAAQREELLDKLESNITQIKEVQKSSNGYRSPTSINNKIKIEGPPEVAPLLEEQKQIIEELKQLNPQTGVLPKIMSKILGVDAPPTETQLQQIISHISPEAKALICK